MTATSTLIVFIVLGQAGDGSRFSSAIPQPTASARRNAENAPALPASRFGAPTPAAPSSAPATAQASDLNLPAGQNNSPPRGSANTAAPTFNAPTLNATADNGGFQPAAAVSTGQPTADTPAKLLIAQAFPTAEDAGEPSQQLTLREAIAASTQRAQRLAIIKTYWEASSLLADWQFAAEEYELISQVAAPNDAASQSVLKAAQAAAKARVIESQMAAKSAQFALADVVPTAAGSAPPLPIDAPFSGQYNTQFETLFAARVAPAGLRRIHETLPLRRDLVDARAAAVSAAAEAVGGQIDAYRGGRSSLAELLKQFENLRYQRGAFLGALRDYNLDIAEYALGAAQSNDSPDKIVGMLIEVAARPAAAAVNGAASDAPLRSVLVAPAGGSTTGLPTPANPRNGLGVPPIPSRIADQSTAGATALPRPPTARVLGTLRDVTNQQPAEVFQPQSTFTAPAGSPTIVLPEPALPTLPPTLP